MYIYIYILLGLIYPLQKDTYDAAQQDAQWTELAAKDTARDAAYRSDGEALRKAERMAEVTANGGEEARREADAGALRAGEKTRETRARSEETRAAAAETMAASDRQLARDAAGKREGSLERAGGLEERVARLESRSRRELGRAGREKDSELQDLEQYKIEEKAAKRSHEREERDRRRAERETEIERQQRGKVQRYTEAEHDEQGAVAFSLIF
jgi:hypothetical protein